MISEPHRWPGLLALGALVLVLIAGAAATLLGAWRPVFRPALIGEETLAVRLHLAAAVTALALGIAIFLARKGRTFHRVAGWCWAGLMMAVAVTSLFITEITPGSYSYIHLFTGWVLVMLPLAIYLIKGPRQVRRHRRAMTGLFLGALVLAGMFTFLPDRLMWRIFMG